MKRHQAPERGQMTSTSDHEPFGPAGKPGPEASGPPGSCGVPDGDFCDDPDDWGLDLDREPPSEEELHGAGFDPHKSPVEGWEVMSDAQRAELTGGDLYPDQDGDEVVPEALGRGPGSRPAGRWMCCCPARTWPGTPAPPASAAWTRCPTTS